MKLFYIIFGSVEEENESVCEQSRITWDWTVLIISHQIFFLTEYLGTLPRAPPHSTNEDFNGNVRDIIWESLKPHLTENDFHTGLRILHLLKHTFKPHTSQLLLIANCSRIWNNVEQCCCADRQPGTEDCHREYQTSLYCHCLLTHYQHQSPDQNLILLVNLLLYDSNNMKSL